MLAAVTLARAAFKSPFVQAALVVLAALVGIKLYGRQREKLGRRIERVKVETEVRKQTDAQIDAAREAENEITRKLNLGQLRDVAATDPNNIGRVRRP